MNTKVMGRFIFPDYPYIKLFISKTAYNGLMKSYQDIFKMYKNSEQDINDHYVYYYQLFHICGNGYSSSFNPENVYIFDFEYKNSFLPSNMINHLSLNFALLIDFINKNAVFNNPEYKPAPFWAFTIVECNFSEFYRKGRKTHTLLTLRYTQPYKGYPYNRRHVIILATSIYYKWVDTLDDILLRLPVPYFIFELSENYYKELPSVSFSTVQI